MHKNWLASLLLILIWSGAHAQPADIDINSDVESALQDDDGSPVEAEAPPSGGDPTLLTQEVEKPSSESGEKRFDWDKHKNESVVKHPNAAKGLIRIGRDKTYYYKVKESPQKSAVSLQFGMFDPVNLKNPDQSGPNATFANNYDQSSNPAVLLMKEWRLFQTPLGKVNLRGGSGIFVAQGHGHFVSARNDDKVPKETFTFVAFPTSAGVVYRLQFADRQLFVPYGEGGLIAMAFSELRDDGKGPKFGGAMAGYGAGGLAINLSYFDYLSRIQMDREYGINAVYLTLEYRKILALSDRYDFTTDYINGGFLIEY